MHPVVLVLGPTYNAITYSVVYEFLSYINITENIAVIILDFVC